MVTTLFNFLREYVGLNDIEIGLALSLFLLVCTAGSICGSDHMDDVRKGSLRDLEQHEHLMDMERKGEADILFGH